MVMETITCVRTPATPEWFLHAHCWLDTAAAAFEMEEGAKGCRLPLEAGEGKRTGCSL